MSSKTKMNYTYCKIHTARHTLRCKHCNIHTLQDANTSRYTHCTIHTLQGTYIHCRIQTLQDMHTLRYAQRNIHTMQDIRNMIYTQCKIHTTWYTHNARYTQINISKFTHCKLPTANYKQCIYEQDVTHTASSICFINLLALSSWCGMWYSTDN